MTRAFRALAAALSGALVVAASAAGGAEEARGPVTNLPLPRFVSLKADEANVRRGPGTTHRIDWVFKRRDMPLLVTAEFANWRRVRDRDGAEGWVHYTLLSGVRTVLIDVEMAALRARPAADAPIRAWAEWGVVARLGDCVPDWCRITAERQRGWVSRAEIWGDDIADLRE
jgi:SH3-like domain-containing protein